MISATDDRVTTNGKNEILSPWNHLVLPIAENRVTENIEVAMTGAATVGENRIMGACAI